MAEGDEMNVNIVLEDKSDGTMVELTNAPDRGLVNVTLTFGENSITATVKIEDIKLALRKLSAR